LDAQLEALTAGTLAVPAIDQAGTLAGFVHGAAAEFYPFAGSNPADGHHRFGVVARYGICWVFRERDDGQFDHLAGDHLWCNEKAAAGLDLVQDGSGIASAADGDGDGPHLARGNVGRLAIEHHQVAFLAALALTALLFHPHSGIVPVIVRTAPVDRNASSTAVILFPGAGTDRNP